MKCLRCQQENPADAVFRQECGTRLEVAYPGCGTVNQLGAKFCKSAAGQPVATKPQAAAVKFPSPEAYTPRHPKQQESSDAANEFRKPKATRGS